MKTMWAPGRNAAGPFEIEIGLALIAGESLRRTRTGNKHLCRILHRQAGGGFKVLNVAGDDRRLAHHGDRLPACHCCPR